MIIDENYTGRRVRIIGKPGDVLPLGIQIIDFDTGEIIDHVYRVELDARKTNIARLFYHNADKQTGNVIADENGAIENKIDVPVAEIDVTAFEVFDGD